MLEARHFLVNALMSGKLYQAGREVRVCLLVLALRMSVLNDRTVCWLTQLVLFQQRCQRVAIGDVNSPSIGSRDSRIQLRMRIHQSLRPLVIRIRKRPPPKSLERSRGRRHSPLRIPRDRLLHLLYPLRRIQPPVTQFDQPASGLGNGEGEGVVGVFGGGDVGRQPFGEQEGLKGGSGRITRVAVHAEPGS